MPHHKTEDFLKRIPYTQKVTYITDVSDTDQQEIFDQMFGNRLVPDMNRILETIPLTVDGAGILSVNPCVIVHDIKVLIKESTGVYEKIGNESQVFLHASQEHGFPKNLKINQDYESMHTFSRYKEYPHLKNTYGSLAGKMRKCIKNVQSVHPLKKADRTEATAVFLGFKNIHDLSKILIEKALERAKGFVDNLQQYELFKTFTPDDINDIAEDEGEVDQLWDMYAKMTRHSLRDSFFEKYQISVREADDALIESHYKETWGIDYSDFKLFIKNFIKRQLCFFSLLDTIALCQPDSLTDIQQEIRNLFKEIHMDTLLKEQDAESVYKILMRQASRNTVMKWLLMQMPEKRTKVSLQKLRTLFLENC